MLSVITCTGGRPEAFALCQGYMAMQEYSGGVQWIIVEDSVPASWVWKFRGDIEIEQEFPFPGWQPGQNTLSRNLLIALGKVKHDKILFLEDDDWYAPSYLENMDKLLDRAPLVGQTPARYYNVATRQYREMLNHTHASLCQTGIRAELIPQLSLCATLGGSIDIRLWRNVKGLLEPGTDVVGIKGMPGRAGIGVGHRPNNRWQSDRDLIVLGAWIGYDAEAYAEYGVCAGAAV